MGPLPAVSQLCHRVSPGPLAVGNTGRTARGAGSGLTHSRPARPVLSVTSTARAG